MSKQLNYFNRNFADLRENLINFTKEYYPTTVSDYNDASIGAMLFDLMAGIGDDLGFHTDTMFQETQLDFMQEKRSIYAKARSEGVKVPGKRPGVTIVDVTISNIPAGTDYMPDPNYCPFIQKGAQYLGAGQSFETMYDMDFASPFSATGIPNRIVLSNSDGSYTITKREIVINGTTKLSKFVIPADSAKPFYEYILNDQNVLSIESIIEKDGVNFSNTPSISDFYLETDTTTTTRWWEVDFLAQNKVFVTNYTKLSDNQAVKPGRWKVVPKRFIKEFTDNGFCKVIFGGGEEQPVFDFSNADLQAQMVDMNSNLALGTKISASKTYFILYRVGGGVTSNLGINTITTVGTMNFNISGTNSQRNNIIKASMVVTNPVPVFGGKDQPSVDEVRYMIKYTKSTNNRGVQISDYKHLISTMPSQYGVPFKLNVFEQQNKIVIAMLGLTTDGKLNDETVSTVKENIATYLSDYRLINDYIEVNTGKIINLAFEVDIIADKNQPQNNIINEVITVIKNAVDIYKMEMGSDVMIGDIIGLIQQVNGVRNISDLRVYNPIGGRYSSASTLQSIQDATTRQINLLGENIVHGEPDSMFEIKYPDLDIKIKIKN